jgi:hypothetical protein
MRFSLKFLILITLLVAIGISFIPMLASIRRADAETAELREQIQQKIGGEKYFSDQTNSAEDQIRRLAQERQRLQLVRGQMSKIFAEAAVPESQVNSREGVLSVREIPLLDLGDGFHKQFRLSVPSNNKFQMRIRFTNGYNESDIDSLQSDFEMIERTVVPLNAGQSVVDFSLLKPNVSGGKSMTNLKLVVSVDSQPVFESWFMHPKSGGGSWANFPFDEQRDYTAADRKLPELISFQPSPGKTKIILSIEKLEMALEDQ